MGHNRYEDLAFKNFTTSEHYSTLTNVSLNGTLTRAEGGPSSLEIFNRISAFSMLTLVMIASGCKVKSQDLLHHLKRPWSILVGMGCQYILLPLLAFCLILVFSLDPNEAVAVMISSTSPAGPVSNLGTMAMEGDVSLRYMYVTVLKLL